MVQIDFSFKSALDKMIGGDGHSLCFQCGACVGDCPAAQYSPRFNPRQIMLDAVLGLTDRLVIEHSVVWDCTNCCNCYEHCPQEVRPVEVINALKNMVHAAGLSPEKIGPLVQTVQNTGRTVLITGLIKKRRQELGLPELSPAPIDELKTLLDM